MELGNALNSHNFLNINLYVLCSETCLALDKEKGLLFFFFLRTLMCGTVYVYSVLYLGLSSTRRNECDIVENVEMQFNDVIDFDR